MRGGAHVCVVRVKRDKVEVRLLASYFIYMRTRLLHTVRWASIGSERCRSARHHVLKLILPLYFPLILSRLVSCLCSPPYCCTSSSSTTKIPQKLRHKTETICTSQLHPFPFSQPPSEFFKNFLFFPPHVLFRWVRSSLRGRLDIKYLKLGTTRIVRGWSAASAVES